MKKIFYAKILCTFLCSLILLTLLTLTASCGLIIRAVKTTEENAYYFTFTEGVLKGAKFDHPSIKFYANNADIAESIISKYENKLQIK